MKKVLTNFWTSVVNNYAVMTGQKLSESDLYLKSREVGSGTKTEKIPFGNQHTSVYKNDEGYLVEKVVEETSKPLSSIMGQLELDIDSSTTHLTNVVSDNVVDRSFSFETTYYPSGWVRSKRETQVIDGGKEKIIEKTYAERDFKPFMEYRS